MLKQDNEISICSPQETNEGPKESEIISEEMNVTCERYSMKLNEALEMNKNMTNQPRD